MTGSAFEEQCPGADSHSICLMSFNWGLPLLAYQAVDRYHHTLLHTFARSYLAEI